ncbi:hypothetical protein CTZ27_29800 [Streptomyces griseocarneus]|nr:hypothetical protein CTZ27_29800 [Streptomyces griseocarneus]
MTSSDHYVISPPAPGRPPGPDRRGRTLLVSLIAIAGLALVAAVVTGVWMLRSTGGDTTTAQGKAAGKAGPWSLDDTSYGLAGARTDAKGIWFQGDTVIKALPEGLIGLDRATGRRQWGIPTPGSGTAICQTSTDITGNRLVLAYGQDSTCDHYFAVDLSARKVLWEHTLKSDDWSPSSGVRIARTGDVVVLEADKHIAEAFRVSDGKSLWQDGNSIYNPKDPRDNCRGKSYTGGKTLLRMERCGTGSPLGDPDYVAAVDPATGRSRWTHRVESENDGVNTEILSTSPVIYSVPDEKHPLDGYLRMRMLDDTGHLRSTLAPGPEHRLNRHTDTGSPPADIRVAGDVLVAVAAPDLDDPKGKDHSKVVAWSLSSGKRLWEHMSTGNLQRFLPVQSPDTTGYFVYSTGHYSDPSTLVRFDLATGRQTTVRQFPASPDEHPANEPSVSLYLDTLYLESTFERALPGIEKDKRNKALIARPIK